MLIDPPVSQLCSLTHPSARSLHLEPFLSSASCSRSPHLYSAHRAITTSHYRTISVSLHLSHYLSVPRSASSHNVYTLSLSLCRCACRSVWVHRTQKHHFAQTRACRGHWLSIHRRHSCGFGALRFSLGRLHINVGTGGITQV